MKIISFYRKLISSDNTASSRRFIAVWTLPFFWGGIIVGYYMGIKYNSFNYYLAAYIGSSIVIFLAFFALTWEHVKEITSGIFRKKDENFIDP